MADPKSTKPTFIERFWSRVQRADGDACWLWTAALFPKGYGKVALPRANGSRQILDGAHRIAWLLTHGPIPDNLWVLHHCDNPPCCRPDHLFLGTCKDNVHDMMAKARYHGNRRRSPHRRFTDEDVQAILKRVEAGESRRAIARELGTNRRSISRLVSGTLYKSYPIGA